MAEQQPTLKQKIKDTEYEITQAQANILMLQVYLKQLLDRRKSCLHEYEYDEKSDTFLCKECGQSVLFQNPRFFK